MASGGKSIEEILGRSINSTKELKAAIKELQDQLVGANTETDEWTKTAEKLTAAQIHLNDVMQAGKQTVDASDDSIAGMEKRYKQMYNTYRLMSEEMRNTDFGKQQATQLAELSARINDTKKNVGNFKDNIGHYADDAIAAFSAMGVSIGGLATPLGLANGGFKTLNATIKANPIFWLITAIQLIIGVFKKLKDAIMSNEESQMKLNEAMAVFQPIIDNAKNALDRMGQVVVNVISWLADAFAKVREIGAAVTDFLGITDGAKERIEDQNKLYKELARRTNELTLAKREQQKANAVDEEHLKVLLEEAAAETDKQKRLEKLNSAKELQAQITERNVRIAEEEYDIALQKSKLTANDAKTNDELVRLETEMNRVRADGASKTKEMTTQIRELTVSTQQYATSVKTAAEIEDEANQKRLRRLEDTKSLSYEYLEKVGSEVQMLENKASEYKTALEGAIRLYDVFKEGEDKGFEKVDWHKVFKDNGIFDDERVQTAEDAYKRIFILAAEYKELLKKIKEIKQAEKDAAAEDAAALTQTSLDQNAAAEIDKAMEIAKKKKEIIESEEIAEIEKNELIKQLDDELLEYEFQNRLWELENLELTNEQKLEIWNAYYERLAEQRKEEMEAQEELLEQTHKNKIAQWDNIAEHIYGAMDIADAIGSLSDAIAQNIELTLEDADATEESVNKKKKQLKALQDIQLAVTLAAIAMDVAGGIMGIWKGYAAEKAVNAQTAAATGPAAAVTLAALESKSLALAIMQTAAIGTMGAAQMAAAIAGNISAKKSIEGTGGGSAAGTIAAPQTIDTTPYSYTRQIQTTEEEEQLNRPIYVTVTDIEAGLNKVEVRDQESSW